MSTSVLLLVRLRRGVVGERARVVHIVSFPTLGEIPESLTAYCGIEIRHATADVLPRPCGMPCERCLARIPRSTGGDLQTRLVITALPSRKSEHTAPDTALTEGGPRPAAKPRP
jgi:hypothetical protein